MITQAFNNLKTRIEPNQSFAESISQKHNAVRSVVKQNIDSNIDTKLIGSLQRQTRIQPRTDETFDIDILVILGQFDQWSANGVTPQMADSKIRQAIRQSSRYESMGPVIDEPAIVFEYKDNIKVELVPAYINNTGYFPSGEVCNPIGRGYCIPKNGQWVHADYDYDADLISALNKKSNEMLVPMVKILKTIKRKHFPNMKSFHLEVVAVNIIPALITSYISKGLPVFYQDLTADFFTEVQQHIDGSTRLPGSNSPNIWFESDNYYQETKKAIVDIANYCHSIYSQASDYQKLNMWKNVISELPTN